MNRTLLVAAGFFMLPFSAFAQGSLQADYRDRSYDDRDGRRSDFRQNFNEGQNRNRRRVEMDDTSGASSSFHMKVGGSQIDVECGPRETMKDCVDAATALLDKARSLPVASNTGNVSGDAQNKH